MSHLVLWESFMMMCLFDHSLTGIPDSASDLGFCDALSLRARTMAIGISIIATTELYAQALRLTQQR